VSNGKILHWIPDVHMANCHDGLAEIAKKKLKINVADLRPGEFVIFTNASFTAIKAYGAGETILHHRSPDRQRLNPKAAMLLPHFIKGQDINYDKALAKVVTEEYVSRYGEISS